MPFDRKRSPLKTKPLRVPGQSLDEAIERVIQRDGYEALIPAALVIVLAVWEWVRRLQPRPQPEIMTALAVVVTGWAAFKIWKARKTIANLRLGRDGEREVAEVLEQLRERQYRVFHDIQGPDFNVDHVLVGPHGVFAIETKTWRKPGRGLATIRYDGGDVAMVGQRPEQGPVRQAEAVAQWIGELVKNSCDRSCFVRPVVLFPGWFVEHRFKARPTVWVLNPKMLVAFIAKEPVRLEAEAMALISSHLALYVRSEASNGWRSGVQAPWG